jgi:hypothetical protein
MVVELAVVREVKPSIGRAHRLVSGGRQVNDSKPSVAQPCGTINEESFIVWTAMAESSRHSRQFVAFDGSLQVRVVKNSGNPTHKR